MVFLAHIAGYRFCGGNLDDLTYNQELLVALIAEEQIKYQVKLAGGEVKETGRRRKRKKAKNDDAYGRQLELNKWVKEQAKAFTEEDLAKYTKPL
mgnify:CR=1 FL=1